jgi:hypothetical protein
MQSLSNRDDAGVGYRPLPAADVNRSAAPRPANSRTSPRLGVWKAFGTTTAWIVSEPSSLRQSGAVITIPSSRGSIDHFEHVGSPAVVLPGWEVGNVALDRRTPGREIKRSCQMNEYMSTVGLAWAVAVVAS